MMKKQKADIFQPWHLLLFLPMIMMMICIFYFSSKPAAISTEESGQVVDIFIKLAERLKGLPFTAKDYETIAELIHTPIRKAAHMTEYAVLGATVLVPLLIIYNRKQSIFWCSILICFLYAVSDEFHQTFIPGRSGEVKDVLIDTIGAVIGCFLCMFLSKRREKRKKQKRERKKYFS